MHRLGIDIPHCMVEVSLAPTLSELNTKLLIFSANFPVPVAASVLGGTQHFSYHFVGIKQHYKTVQVKYPLILCYIRNASTISVYSYFVGY